LETLASTVLQVRQYYDEVKVNKAIVESKRTALSQAQYDYENRSRLVGAKAVSKEEFTHAKDTLTIAQSDLDQAEAKLKTAMDAAGNTALEQHPQIDKQKSNVRIAYYNLQHCCIYAATTGYVAKRMVGVGQWVTQTANLMSIIPEQDMWVDANFKETQLKYMRVGQPATVWFDLYGSKVKYTGKVLGIALGTGSVFAIIPPQNATGNWIKIVQRLPVRISLDPDQIKKYPIRMGISAEVDVDITNQDLPRLVNVISTQPVAATQVFQLDLSKVDEVIQKVIQQHISHD
jgi:membrane fusion protein, multidrug efflux system